MSKKLCATVIMFAGVALSGCLKHPDSLPAPDQSTYFDFATTQVMDIAVNYGLEGYRTGLLFEVYAENPYENATVGNSTIPVKKTDLKPVFKGYTSTSGVFNGKVSLPTWVKKVYITTDYPVSHPCVEVDVNGSVNFNLKSYVASRAGSDTRAATRAWSLPNGFFALNNWDTRGVPENLLTETVPAGLLSDIRNVLKSNNSLPARHPNLVPDEVGNYPNHNISIKSTSLGAEVEFVFLTSDAMLKNSIGYYNYPTGQKPASPANVHKTIIFPYMSGAGHPLVSGNKIKLKYWNETAQKYESVFPAGTSIGFVLIPDGYAGNNGNIVANTRGDAATVVYSDATWNFYGRTPADPNKLQQTVALHSEPHQLIVLGFEDLTRCVSWPYHDHDFDDAIFYCRVSPYSAIDPEDHDPDDLDPDPDPEPDSYTVEYQGTLAFEDLWPSQGDYDMNDVGIRYHSTVTFNLSNRVMKTVDVFEPIRKGADFKDGFGYQFNVAPSAVTSSTKVTAANGESLPAAPWYPLANGLEIANPDKATVMLFDDIKQVVVQQDGEQMAYLPTDLQWARCRYEVTNNFGGTLELSQIGFPPYNPFIVVIHAASGSDSGVDRRNREVHLPNFAPTAPALCTEAFDSWFGYKDDRSYPLGNVWYTSTLYFPFAINIPTLDFKFPLETVRIDKVYSKYENWAISRGASDQDWYLHPNP